MGVSTVMGVPENGWFIREYATNMDDDWGYPYFRKPSHVNKMDSYISFHVGVVVLVFGCCKVFDVFFFLGVHDVFPLDFWLFAGFVSRLPGTVLPGRPSTAGG